MATAPHVIYQQRLHLRLPADTPSTTTRHQQAEQALLAPALLHALDEALTQALADAGLPPDAWLTLEHLTLDAGALRSADLPGQLLARLPALLRQGMAEARPAGAARSAPPAGADEEPAGAGALAGASPAASRATAPLAPGDYGGQLLPAALAPEAAWLHFLQHGTLPAHWPRPATPGEWEAALRLALQSPQAGLVRGLRLALAEPASRLRLVRQFSAALCAAVLVALAPVGSPPPATLRQQLAHLLRPTASGYPEAGPEALVLAQLAQAVQSGLVPPGSGLAARAEEPAEDLTHPVGKLLPDKAIDYITNAGLVLLHPFLPTCFEACGWLAGGQFSGPEAQAQAVLLLHYLATGRGQAPEYDLRLPRLLCGVPADAPAPRRLVLPRAARAEGRALLLDAIGHWSALRSTSPQGLRTAFLQREGKLETSPAGGLVLTVAQQAQDVLLSRLPYGWGVSLVQLPWLATPLTVEWA
ncbi:MAG TPA: contractile injection system tape measure protein [Hymenobacter sp.]|uniref:contractile injection system tape measure protein n=1 Tax=Hymenobacter sp. TaxID=1898978 RepID=UPI002D81172F|nr:contractile injection system tape measure protein [Hymenobacter sp.]HET9505729.1 contractile injection system tape measure protein [Hymenobacter sp.]